MPADEYCAMLMHYRLRTLLILMAVVPPMLAGAWMILLAPRTIGSATINGTQVVFFRSPLLGGVGISDDGKTVNAEFGSQAVSVDARQVEIVGVRRVPLPASWKRVELTRTLNDVQIVVDGARSE
jgi:hypothetical protein